VLQVSQLLTDVSGVRKQHHLLILVALVVLDCLDSGKTGRIDERRLH